MWATTAERQRTQGEGSVRYWPRRSDEGGWFLGESNGLILAVGRNWRRKIFLEILFEKIGDRYIPLLTLIIWYVYICKPWKATCCVQCSFQNLIYCPRFPFYVPHWMLASTSATAASAAAPPPPPPPPPSSSRTARGSHPKPSSGPPPAARAVSDAHLRLSQTILVLLLERSPARTNNARDRGRIEW